MKGQITRFITYLIDLIRPRFVYEVVSSDSWRAGKFFRTERGAHRYIDKQEETDPYIYNGVYYLELRKHNYYGEKQDNKA